MNVSFIIQYSNHRHVSANHVTIYRVENNTITIIMRCNKSTVKNFV